MKNYKREEKNSHSYEDVKKEFFSYIIQIKYTQRVPKALLINAIKGKDKWKF